MEAPVLIDTGRHNIYFIRVGDEIVGAVCGKQKKVYTVNDIFDHPIVHDLYHFWIKAIKKEKGEE